MFFSVGIQRYVLSAIFAREMLLANCNNTNHINLTKGELSDIAKNSTLLANELLNELKKESAT